MSTVPKPTDSLQCHCKSLKNVAVFTGKANETNSSVPREIFHAKFKIRQSAN